MSDSATTTARPARATTALERPRGGRARAVAELVPALGAATCRRFGFVQSSVVARWGEIVGARYAAAATPESIRFPRGKRDGGTLNLAVFGAHGPMIQHVAPAIVERVNRFFGYEAVARIVIRPAASPAAPAPTSPRPAAAVPIELGDSLRAIGDPELRAVLESLARGVVASPLPVLGKVR